MNSVAMIRIKKKISSERMIKERWLHLLSDYWPSLLLLQSAKVSITLRSFLEKGGLKTSILSYFTHTLSLLFSVSYNYANPIISRPHMVP